MPAYAQAGASAWRRRWHHGEGAGASDSAGAGAESDAGDDSGGGMRRRQRLRATFCIALKSDWDTMINNTLAKAKLTRPEDEYMATGGKKGLHTESLGFILSEMQYLQRAYPNAKW